MATTDSIPDITAPSVRSSAGLLVLLSDMPHEQFKDILAKLTVSFKTEDLIIAGPESLQTDNGSALRFVRAAATNGSWILTASDFVNAYQLAVKNEAHGILILGPESDSLSSSALCGLASAVLLGSTDLAVPRYDLQPHARLITSAILYPLTRALFASHVRLPQALDLGLSLRMAERLALAAHRFSTHNQNDELLWPVNEAAVAGFAVSQIEVGPRAQPQPIGNELNTVLPQVTGSLFADIDAKAAFWQRSRPLQTSADQLPSFAPTSQTPSTEAAAEIVPMLQAFRLAYTNLQEIWQLVLPPSSLVGLKRISTTDGAAFRMPDSLWVRIVYDFLLAHRLRTINRGHLLGALIPLYLAWLASHLNIISSGIDPELHIESLAAAFEADKTYLVSRWRWPDRFNP
jgi:hypothetical protein